jgi:hypothetical protein
VRFHAFGDGLLTLTEPGRGLCATRLDALKLALGEFERSHILPVFARVGEARRHIIATLRLVQSMPDTMRCHNTCDVTLWLRIPGRSRTKERKLAVHSRW